MLRTLTLFFAVIRTSESSVFDALDGFGLFRHRIGIMSLVKYDLDDLPYYRTPFRPTYNADQTNRSNETKSSDDYNNNLKKEENVHTFAEDSEEYSEEYSDEDSEEDEEEEEEEDDETYMDYEELRIPHSTSTELYHKLKRNNEIDWNKNNQTSWKEENLEQNDEIDRNQNNHTSPKEDLEQNDETNRNQNNHTSSKEDYIEDLEQNDETDWNKNNHTSSKEDYIEDLEQNDETNRNQNNHTSSKEDYIEDLEQNDETDWNKNNHTSLKEDYTDDLEQNDETNWNQNNHTSSKEDYTDDLEQNNQTDWNQNNHTSWKEDYTDDLEQNIETDGNQNNQTSWNQDYLADLEPNNQTEKSTLNDEAQSNTLNTKNNVAQSNQPGEDPTGQASAGQDNQSGVLQSSQPKSVKKMQFKNNIRKCCNFGYGYDVKKEKCAHTAEPFNPPVYRDYRFVEDFKVTNNFKFGIGLPRCSVKQKMKLTPVSNISEVYHVSTAGVLVVEVPYSRSYTSMSLYTQEFCVDTFITGVNETKFSAMICFQEKIEKDVQYYTLSCICMLVTCVLIMLRVILFAWLPELRTLHGMILMAYLISFLIGFLLLACTQLLFERNYITQDICTYFAFLIYFSTLSAFFWRNVMCYDIWWTFCGKRAFTSRGSCSRARFGCYSLYAFGAPTAFTVLLAALEFSDFSHHPLMPKLRVQGCFLYGYNKVLYLYGPVIVLFIVNIIFSTITALRIAAIKKETKNVLQTNESNTHDQQKATKRFTLYLKLFAAMAFLEINWILEVISVFYPEAASILHISDIYNILVPLIIFVNFVCRKKTWRMIKKRYRQVKGLPPVEVTTSRTLNSLSQDECKSQVKQI